MDNYDKEALEYLEQEAQKEYPHMKEVVEKMCWSMVNEPDLWEIDTYTFKKKESNIEYWHGVSAYNCIRSTWRPREEVVFSIDQGRRVSRAFKTLKSIRASQQQLAIIEEYKLKEKVVVPQEEVKEVESRYTCTWYNPISWCSMWGTRK
jgi:hypothetical protein